MATLSYAARSLNANGSYGSRGKLPPMRTTLTPAVAIHKRLWIAILGAVLLAAANPLQAQPADQRAKGDTRTYDVFDLLWYSADGDDPNGRATRKSASESLVRIVTESIEPRTWEGPNATNTIEEKDGRLIVTAKLQVHIALARMLRQFRETPALQGVSLDCHFIIAEEAFLKLRAPATLERKEPGASVRGIDALKARSILEAARETPGVVVMPVPPLPLYHLPSSLLIGEERRLRLPRLGADKGAAVEVMRPAGLSLSVCAVAGARYVTLDLMARSSTLEVLPSAGGTPGWIDEIEGLYHGTFAVERSGTFLVRAPLVRAKLAGVRQPEGELKNGEAGAAGQEAVREVAAAQSDPPRYLLLVGTVRPMSIEEVTVLAGRRVAMQVNQQFPELGASPAAQPTPPTPVKSTRVYDLRALLLGSEPGPQRAPARAKRLEQVLARVKEVVPADAPLREQNGLLIITAMPRDFAKISTILDELSAQRLVQPE
jgi:hypothetical protein